MHGERQTESAPETLPGPLAMLEELDEPGPLVGILVGSESDREAMEPALEELDARGITHEFSVMSAHRDRARWPSMRPPRRCAASAS